MTKVNGIAPRNVAVFLDIKSARDDVAKSMGIDPEEADAILSDGRSVAGAVMDLMNEIVARRHEAQLPISIESIAIGLRIFSRHIMPELASMSDEEKAFVLACEEIIDRVPRIQPEDAEPAASGETVH